MRVSRDRVDVERGGGFPTHLSAGVRSPWGHTLDRLLTSPTAHLTVQARGPPDPRATEPAQPACRFVGLGVERPPAGGIRL